MRYFILIQLFLFAFASNAQWRQLGQDILGNFPDQNLGYVDITPDGKTMAVGLPGRTGAGTITGNGRVRVYELISNSWVQKGYELTGVTSSASHLGLSVSISNNGNIVAVGVPGISKVFVFEWNGTSWVRRGPDINGRTYNDYFGVSVSLSGNGNTIAIGAPNNDNSSGLSAGEVRMYSWTGTWTPKGNGLIGSNLLDFFGSSVAINDNGNVVVVGVPGADPFGQISGLVRAFRWNGSNWVQKGTDLNGTRFYEQFGDEVKISDDGNVIAVNGGNITTTPFPSSLIRVYEWNNGSWSQRGANVGTNNQSFGIALSGDGLTLVESTESTADSTILRVHKWNGSTWSNAGRHVVNVSQALYKKVNKFSCTTFGDTIAAGITTFDVNLSGQTLIKAGKAMVFTESSTVGIKEMPISKLNLTARPNPTNGMVYLESNKPIEFAKVSIYNPTGKLINKLEYRSWEQIELNLKGKPGLYFIRVEFSTGIQSFKIMKL